LPAVESQLKIRARYLDALEQERFDALPGEAYVRGFLRSYADFLGLDGQLYVDEYASRFAAEEEPPEREHAPRRRLRVRPPVLVAVGGALVLAVVGLIAWGGGGSSTPSQNRAAVVSRPRTHRPVARRRPATPVVRPRAAKLVLRAAGGRCWVLAYAGSSAGRKLYEGTLEQGQSLRLTGKRLWLRLGAPEMLVATVDGGSVALPSGPTNVVVTPAGLRVVS
jgi:hypothetical protein